MVERQKDGHELGHIDAHGRCARLRIDRVVEVPLCVHESKTEQGRGVRVDDDVDAALGPEPGVEVAHAGGGLDRDLKSLKVGADDGVDEDRQGGDCGRPRAGRPWLRA